MQTVFAVLTNYCNQNNLPSPSKNDLSDVGRIVSHHFKSYWAPNQMVDDRGFIVDTGFIKTTEGGKPMIVVAYPDTFLSDMQGRIKIFYENKGKEKPANNSKEKKDRKRIPVKKAEYSSRKK